MTGPWRGGDRHERVWTKVTWQTNQLGQATAQAGSFVEVATGLCYRDDQGRWRDSEDLIELAADGSACAVRGPHKVYFSPNLNSAGAITLVTASNHVFKIHLLGLAYYDAASGKAVLLSGLQGSSGELLPPNQIVYKSAFANINADVRYTYTKAGFESDVILLQQPPPPEAYGLDPRTTRLEVWHEFVGAPTPALTPRLLASESDPAVRSQMVEPDFTDQLLDFGELWFPTGSAYACDASAVRSTNTAAQIRVPTVSGRDSGQVAVAKTWVRTSNRQVLVEAVRWQDARPKLQGLPQGTQSLPPAPVQDRIACLSQLSNPNAPQQAGPPIKMARADYVPKGFVLDYLVVQGSGNFTFATGVTYYLSGMGYFGGTVTFQAGSVVKYANNAYLLMYGPVVCSGTAAFPSILTSGYDNLFGEPVLQGTPTYSAASAMWFYYVTSSYTVTGMRIRWAHTGIQWDAYSANLSLQDSTLEFCETGLLDNSGSQIYINNCTACQVATPYLPYEAPIYGVFSDYCSDTDHDGLPDSWMMTHFGHPTGQAYDLSHAGDDPDGDGLTNLQEYQLGTDPRVATPPVILSQPLSQTVLAGANVTFGVGALPSSLIYVWYHNGAWIPGNGASLTLNNVQPGDAGNYSVLVYNGAGSATSSAATLTLATPTYKAIVNGSYSRDKSGAYHSSGDYDSFGPRAPAGWSCWMSGMNVPGWTTARCRSNGMVTLTTSAMYSDCCIFAPGDVINVSGLSRPGYNGQFTLTSAWQYGAGPYLWTISYSVPGYADASFDELPTPDGGGAVTLNGINCMGWTEYGDALIRKAADHQFNVFAYYGGAFGIDQASYYAIQRDCPVFTFHSAPNTRHYFDYLANNWGVTGNGPLAAALVAGGGWTATESSNAYGPQGEFLDAACVENSSDCGCNGLDTAQSWAFSATAAKYATVKNVHPDWNPFDIRQYLRQVSTFYNVGWRQDGGFGYPQVVLRCSLPSAMIQALSPLTAALPGLNVNSLEAGTPLEPRIDASTDRRVLTFSWMNWQQTVFVATVIQKKVGANNPVTIYEGTGSSLIWHSNEQGDVTFYFLTKLSGLRTSRLESYTQILVPNLSKY